MHQIAVQILEATIGIQSDQEEILPSLPFGVKAESLLTDFLRVEQISYGDGLDGYISIKDIEREPKYISKDNAVIIRGPFSRLQREASDQRYTLWGNQGFLYRYALYLLEKKHGIFNFHACALYQEDKDKLYVIIGGAGSGKSVYLLSGLEKGLRLFSTETVHFRLDQDNITWFMGSAVDNIRYGTLIHDFPRFLPSGDIPDMQDQWQKKIAIELSEYCSHNEIIKNPTSIHILFPRIEKGFEQILLNPIKDRKKTVKILFDNITQKLAETIVLYDKMAVLGLDEIDMARERLRTANELAGHETVTEISSVLCSPNNCWERILE